MLRCGISVLLKISRRDLEIELLVTETPVVFDPHCPARIPLLIEPGQLLWLPPNVNSSRQDLVEPTDIGDSLLPRN